MPAVYVMYGGQARSRYAAYVGIADRLKQRALQHLVNRDSSVTTGTSAVTLNPDLVTELRWWEHPRFADRAELEAAELVAFDVLQPVLRSRGATSHKARTLYADEQFRQVTAALFSGEPTGRFVVPTLHDALQRIADLERRLEILEQRLAAG